MKVSKKTNKGKTKAFQPFDLSDKFSWILLSLSLLLAAILRSAFLEIPFERDEGTYVYYGWLTLLGKTPYVDFYAMKPPGLFYFYGGLIALFGKGLTGLHIAFILLNLSSITFLFLSAKELMGKPAAVFAAFAFVIVSLSRPITGFSIQAEHLLMALSLPALYLAIKYLRDQKLWQLFISGILIALAFTVKQNALFFIIAAGLLPVFVHLKDWKKLFMAWTVFSVAILLVFALAVAIIAAQGALDAFLFWTFEYPQSYVTDTRFDVFKEFSTSFRRFFIDAPVYWVFCLLGLSVGNFLLRDTRVAIISIAFFVLSFLSITPSLKFFNHYWIQMTVAVALSGAVLIAGLVKFFNTKQMKPGGFLIPALIAVPVLINIGSHSDYYFSPDYTKVLRDTYGMNPFPECKELSDQLEKQMKADDEVYVFGSEPQIYTYLDKIAPSRHAYIAHLVGPHPDHVQWQAELIEDLETDMPEWVVMFQHSSSWNKKAGSSTDILDWFNKIVGRTYETAAVVDMLPAEYGGTKYIWGEAAANHKVRSSLYIYILKKR